MTITLNWTTTVPVTKTLAEVQAILGEHGAASIAVHYADRQPVGVAFVLAGPHGPRTFTLPVDVTAVHTLLNTPQITRKIRGANKGARQYQSPEHAARVAWRVLKDWLEAQLAIVQAGMATLDQVMIPYLHVDDTGLTLYQAYQHREQAALEAGGSA